MDRSKKNLHRPEYIIFHFRKVVGRDTHRAWELRFAVALFRHRDTSETLTAEQYYSLIQAGALAFGAAYEELRDAFPYRDFQEGADAFAFLAGVWAGRIDSNECRGNIVSDAQDRLFEHIGALQDIEPEVMAEMMDLAQQAIRKMESVYSPEGFNIGVNQGRVAGAGVEGHIHLHVVPRWAGDNNYMPVLADTRVMPQSLEETYDALEGGFS